MFDFLSVAMPLSAFLGYQLYTYVYFRSAAFLAVKDSISQHTIDCNELNDYIENLKSTYVHVRSIDYGVSDLNDSSRYNMKRKKWQEAAKSDFVHNCSATVCKNAHNQPFKYLCKYFDIKVDEETLSKFEEVLNNFAAAEQGKNLLKVERDEIVASIEKKIPFFISRFSKRRLIKELGFQPIDLSSLYFPVYTFKYVSAGGNSSSNCVIKLDLGNLENFISYLSSLIKFRKSVAGQRALMTSKLREKIKTRDKYTCQFCALSITDERNLLLEIDHITPLAKGGITSEDNLQTLCWKCNRSKGAKILAVEHSGGEHTTLNSSKVIY